MDMQKQIVVAPTNPIISAFDHFSSVWVFFLFDLFFFGFWFFFISGVVSGEENIEVMLGKVVDWIFGIVALVVVMIVSVFKVSSILGIVVVAVVVVVVLVSGFSSTFVIWKSCRNVVACFVEWMESSETGWDEGSMVVFFIGVTVFSLKVENVSGNSNVVSIVFESAVCCVIIKCTFVLFFDENVGVESVVVVDAWNVACCFRVVDWFWIFDVGCRVVDCWDVLNEDGFSVFKVDERDDLVEVNKKDCLDENEVSVFKVDGNVFCFVSWDDLKIGGNVEVVERDVLDEDRFSVFKVDENVGGCKNAVCFGNFFQNLSLLGTPLGICGKFWQDPKLEIRGVRAPLQWLFCWIISCWKSKIQKFL